MQEKATPSASASAPSVHRDAATSQELSRTARSYVVGILVVAFGAALLIALIWLLTYERIAHEHHGARQEALRHTSTMTHVMEQHTVRTLQQAEQTMVRIAHEFI